MKQTVEIFPWTDKLSTGITIIDSQHEKLVDLVNALFSALGSESNSDILHKAFSDLTDYIAYHFNTEQMIWDQHFGSDVWITSHRSAHGAFVKAIDRLKMGVDLVPPAELTEKLTAYLVNWLVLHILDEDRRMASAARALESGMAMEAAKAFAENEMRTNAPVLLDATLFMYQEVSRRTIELMREKVRRETAERELEASKKLFEQTLDAVCIADFKLDLLYANKAFLSQTGLTPEQARGSKLADLKSGFADEATVEAIWNALQTDGIWSGPMTNRSPSGALDSEWLSIAAHKDEDGNLKNYALTFSNFSQLLGRRHQLSELASYDHLTNLPSLLILKDRLAVAISHSQRTRKPIAVCSVDIGGLKAINEKFGPSIGDMVVVKTATRLMEALRSCDSLGRSSGGRFVIVMPNIEGSERALPLLEGLLRTSSLPIPLQSSGDGVALHVHVSIGVAMYPDDSKDSATLIQLADQALAEAAQSGGGRYQFISSSSRCSA